MYKLSSKCWHLNGPGTRPLSDSISRSLREKLCYLLASQWVSWHWFRGPHLGPAALPRLGLGPGWERSLWHLWILFLASFAGFRQCLKELFNFSALGAANEVQRIICFLKIWKELPGKKILFGISSFRRSNSLITLSISPAAVAPVQPCVFLCLFPHWTMTSWAAGPMFHLSVWAQFQPRAPPGAGAWFVELGVIWISGGSDNGGLVWSQRTAVQVLTP